MSSLGVASVVTLQFGAHANAVGAHYWNIQDDAHGGDDDGDDGDGESSIEWRVEYAERGAASASGETSSYVPRVVMFDARGMIARTTTTGSRAAASAEAASAAEGTWGGRCSVFRAPLAKRSAFVLALEREAKAREAEAAVRKIARGEDSEAEEEEARELGRRKLGGVGRALERGSKGRERATLEDPEDVKRELIEAASKLDVEADHWSDYLKVELRAKNAFALAGRWEGVDAFEGFGEGLEWIDSEDRREDVRDAVRYWAEDCDTLGGFRILCDDSTAFGGVCARALEDIRDDYDGRTVSVFSVRPPAVREKKARGHAQRRIRVDDARWIVGFVLSARCVRRLPDDGGLAAKRLVPRLVRRRARDRGDHDALATEEFGFKRSDEHARDGQIHDESRARTAHLGANVRAFAHRPRRRRRRGVGEIHALGHAGDADASG